MKLKIWFRKLWHQYGPKRQLIIVEGDTPPKHLSTKHLYLARDDGEDWSIAMQCPCGCKDRLEMMLIKEVKPHWSLKTLDTAYPTLHPSVWRKSGCGAHFWVKNGRIHWC